MTEEQAQAQGGAAEGSLLEQILDAGSVDRGDETFETTERGLKALVAELAKPENKQQKLDSKIVDLMIAEIDRKLGLQLDEILHQPEFQKLEAAWSSLKYLVDHTNFRENTYITMFNISKDQLLEDFEDSPEIVKSGLYKHIYTEEYGQFGGRPYGAMIANYEFGPGPQDIGLLQNVGAVAAMAHAPFIAAAGAQFFGDNDITGLPNMKDLQGVFEGPKYIKWNSFRESEDSRYVALAMPRYLLRLPYDPQANPVKAFEYHEEIGRTHDNYLWGNAAFAMAARITDSFAKYRWCPNIIGPTSGGAVEDLPLHQFESMGDIETKIPTEVTISDRRELELADQGFMPLVYRKGSDNAAFFSAQSCHKPAFYGTSAEAKAAETNDKLGSMLPYMFIVGRIAHYLKVIQRENIGSWKERADIEKELNDWIAQFVSDQEVVTADVRSRRPLRKAAVEVNSVEGDPGWYAVSLKVRPHFKFMGVSIDLSLVGKLDKS